MLEKVYSFTEYLPVIRKALVVPLVGVVLAVLAKLGVTPEMSVEDAVTVAVTAVLVYLVPNRK